jgi:hypothetical protein
MKTKLLIAAIVLSCGMQANAAISVDRTMSQEYLQNNGYSKQIYDTVNVSRSRALGEEYYSSEELKIKNSKAPVSWWHKFHAYFDPAIDDYSFYHHDNNPEPRATDL